MEIITRQEARQRGDKTYFTGVACKNGHVARRYVQSGTCSACIRASNSPVDDPNVEARSAAKSQLVQVKFRLFDVDLDVFKAAAYAMALARFPVLLAGDVFPGLLPLDKGGGTALYKLNCHEGDIAQLREIAESLRRARSVDGNKAREQAHGKAVASVSVVPAPEWSRIPQPGDPDWMR